MLIGIVIEILIFLFFCSFNSKDNYELSTQHPQQVLACLNDSRMVASAKCPFSCNNDNNHNPNHGINNNGSNPDNNNDDTNSKVVTWVILT